MRLILEFVDFLKNSWRKEVEESIEFHVFEDFLDRYKLKILFDWGMWMPDLHGFHVTSMALALAEKAPDRAVGSKNCLRISIMNIEWSSDVGGFKFDLEIRQDENTKSEFDHFVEVLRDELGYYMNVLEIKVPEKIEKTNYQISIDVIFEEKKKK